jgi:hypothetical protein
MEDTHTHTPLKTAVKQEATSPVIDFGWISITNEQLCGYRNLDGNETE